MPIMKKTFFLAMFLLLATVRLFAQASVSGVVTDPIGKPIQGLEVGLLVGNGDRVSVDDATLVALTKTDSIGQYFFEGIPAGKYAVSFNCNHKDTVHQSLCVVDIALSDNDFLLDVSINMFETVAYSYMVPSPPAEWTRIDGEITGLPIHKKAMIVFEVMGTGKKQVVYTNKDGIFFWAFPPETGRVKVHVFAHEGKSLWRKVKSCIRRPQKRCQHSILISVKE